MSWVTSTTNRCLTSATAWLVLGVLTASSLSAQQPAPPPPRPPQAVAPTPKAPAAAPAPGGEAALRQRVEQLEEQLVDMQVVIGTLESLARGSAAPTQRQAPGAAAAMNASEAGRLDGMETQIRALAAQLEQLQEQVRALGGRQGAIPQPPSHAALDPPPARPGRPPPPAANPDRSSFGATTVSPEKEDESERTASQPPGAGAPPSDADANPKQLYETAYAYLLQRDYGAAEASFDEFLRRHPTDPLAGNAQYWLGESLYVRGQYRAAAGAFLKGYQTYTRSTKAPESLLKLAMSLQRLGQKDAACSSYNELSTKFPNAPTHVKTSAQTERQRAGC